MSKILLVDDDELLRQLYYETLAAEGYTVETASSGSEAVEKMKLGGWDLVLLDVVLPDLNGLEIAEKLKHDPRAATNKKLVFLTNIDKEQDIKKAEALGDGYIIKSSVNPGEFVEKVKKYLMI